MKIQAPFIVAIDGTGKSGKDALAENLAKDDMFGRHSLRIVNAGNYTRYLTMLALENKLDLTDKVKVSELVTQKFPTDYTVTLNYNLSAPEIGNQTRHLVDVPELSQLIRQDVQKIVHSGSHDIYFVLSRNAGTFIVPDEAAVKFYLLATDETILQRHGDSREDILARNASDQCLPNNTLDRPDTIFIDTNNIKPDQVYMQAREKLLPFFS